MNLISGVRRSRTVWPTCFLTYLQERNGPMRKRLGLVDSCNESCKFQGDGCAQRYTQPPNIFVCLPATLAPRHHCALCSVAAVPTVPGPCQAGGPILLSNPGKHQLPLRTLPAGAGSAWPLPCPCRRCTQTRTPWPPAGRRSCSQFLLGQSIMQAGATAQFLVRHRRYTKHQQVSKSTQHRSGWQPSERLMPAHASILSPAGHLSAGPP